MGILKIKNLSCLTDANALLRVALFISSKPDALIDSSGKQIIAVRYNPISFGVSEYVVIDVD